MPDASANQGTGNNAQTNQNNNTTGAQGNPGDSGQQQTTGSGSHGTTQNQGQQNNQQTGSSGEGHEFNNPNWDEGTQKYIQSLRQENARYRTKAKGLEDQMSGLNDRMSQFETGIKKALGIEDNNLTPEQQVQALETHNEQISLQNEILMTAVEYGIGKDGLDYFQFLLGKRLEGLEEGQELNDEDLKTIAQEVQVKTGGTLKGGSTSVNGANGGNGKGMPNPNSGSEISLDQFCEMNMVEKSQLHRSQPELYNRLHAQAVQHRRFV